MRTRTIVTLAVALASAPTAAHAQILKHIAADARAHAQATKKNVETHVEGSVAGVADSSMDRADRKVGDAASAVQRAGDSTITRAGRSVNRAALEVVGAGHHDDEAIAAALAHGRYVMRDPIFVAGSAQLAPDAQSRLTAIAHALSGTSTVYVVEVHASDAPDAIANDALSRERAVALKSALVSAGVPTARLVTVGYGATRPPTDGGAPTRVEFTAAQ